MGRYKDAGPVQLHLLACLLLSFSLHTKQASKLPGEISMLKVLSERKKKDLLPLLLLAFLHSG